MEVHRVSTTLFLAVFSIFLVSGCNSESEDNNGLSRYKVDGKVVVPFTADQEWIGNTRILVDGGEFLGFLK